MFFIGLRRSLTGFNQTCYRTLTEREVSKLDLVFSGFAGKASCYTLKDFQISNSLNFVPSTLQLIMRLTVNCGKAQSLCSVFLL